MILLIVESPSKKKKITEILGPGYRVEASFGHIRDLPEKGGIAIEVGPDRCVLAYEVSSDKGKNVSVLKRLAAEAEEVILATDPDREGEAIAWHLTQVLGRRSYSRAKFNSLTAPVIKNGVASRAAIDMHLVGAQQARRALDRAMGWMVSGLCKTAIVTKGFDGKSVSAGRVQSVALRLVVDRERQINNFKSKNYWEIWGEFGTEKSPGLLVGWDGKPVDQGFETEQAGADVVAYCQAHRLWHVLEVNRERKEVRPQAPFTTSSLQQSCSVRLNLRPAETMKIAQTLYEGGHITYMRTDSTAFAPEAIAEIRAVLAKLFPAQLPEKPQEYKKGSANAQEAHEAIRPTHPEQDAVGLGLQGEEAKVYDLIRLRSLASQSKNAIDDVTSVLLCPRIKNPRALFLVKGKRQVDPGWRAILPPEREALPDEEKTADPQSVSADLLVKQAAVPGTNFINKQCKTRPPRRYTEATLIRALEANGVGRPSTYAEIIRTLYNREYIETKKKQLWATDRGCAVIDYLVVAFKDDFIELEFTTKTEKDLDRIAEGDLPWERFASGFITSLHKKCITLGMTRDPFAVQDEKPLDETVYEIPEGLKSAPCRTCDEPIYFIKLEDGPKPKWRILSLDGKLHFQTCKKGRKRGASKKKT